MSPITAWTTHNFVPKVELSYKKLNIDPCTPKIDCPTAPVSLGASFLHELIWGREIVILLWRPETGYVPYVQHCRQGKCRSITYSGDFATLSFTQIPFLQKNCSFRSIISSIRSIYCLTSFTFSHRSIRLSMISG